MSKSTKSAHSPKWKPDIRVTHRTYGAGTVLDEWGCWLSCPTCYRELERRVLICRCGYHAKTRIAVTGRGVFEVMFDGALLSRPIHFTNLTESSGRLEAAA